MAQYKTEQRTILLNFLKSHPDKMFTTKQIEEALAQKNISRSAVYRNIAILESENKIKRCAKNGNREVFYQFFDLQSCKSHIHLSCTECGEIFHLETEITNNIENIVQKEGFQINKTETILYGTCKNCSK